jgi:hypothetical protein
VGVTLENSGNMTLTGVVLAMQPPRQAEIVSSTVEFVPATALMAASEADLELVIGGLEIAEAVEVLLRLRIDAGPGASVSFAVDATAQELATRQATQLHEVIAGPSLSLRALRRADGVLLAWQVPAGIASHTFSVWGSVAPRWRGAEQLAWHPTAREAGTTMHYEYLVTASEAEAFDYYWVKEEAAGGSTVVHGPVSPGAPGPALPFSTHHLPYIRH